MISLANRAMASGPNAPRSPPSSSASEPGRVPVTHSRSRPFEKNFSFADRVSSTAGPSVASTSSRAASRARVNVVFQRFSPSVIVSVTTVPRSRW